MIIAQIERDLLKIWISIKKALPLFLIVLVVMSPLLFLLDKNTLAPAPPPIDEPGIEIGIEQNLRSDLSLWNYETTGIKAIWFDSKDDLLEALTNQEMDYALTSTEIGELQLLVGKSKRVKDFLADEIVTFLASGTNTPVVVASHETGAKGHSNSPKIAWAAVVALIVFISIVSSFLVWEERAMGYLEELIASPASHLSIMISKLLAVLITVGGAFVALFVIVLLFTAGIALFGDASDVVAQGAGESTRSGSGLTVSTAAYILSVIAGISSVAAILVIIQLTIRDRMIISLVTLTFNVPLFFLPLIVPVEAFADASWAWMLPVVNIYGDLSYAMLQGDASYSFFPGMIVNLITLCAVIAIGAISVGRIKDWPSR
jgi:ABC-type Na+ efflux pump permease subunit